MRLRESSLGNFFADLMRLCMNSDIALLQSGNIRGEIDLLPGAITIRDLYRFLSFQDTIVKVSLTGIQILDALENGVSFYPEIAGRFL